MENSESKSCVGCGHRRPISDRHKKSYKICHYILDTGEPRGCPVEKCKHYTTEECHIKEDLWNGESDHAVTADL